MDNAGALGMGVSGGLPQGELVWPPHKHISYFSVPSSKSFTPIVSLEQTGEVGVIIMSVLQMRKLRSREAK